MDDEGLTGRRLRSDNGRDSAFSLNRLEKRQAKGQRGSVFVARSHRQVCTVQKVNEKRRELVFNQSFFVANREEDDEISSSTTKTPRDDSQRSDAPQGMTDAARGAGRRLKHGKLKLSRLGIWKSYEGK